MKRIVIIEDHPVLVSIYRNKFMAEGFQVEIASDGESGLELINRIKPDLVVLDLAMPKINGIEVLKRLRANPLFQTLPVIIFSDSAWQQQAWKEGATVVLSKSGHSPSQVVESARNALLTSASQIEEILATNAAFLAAAPTISSALDHSGFQVTSVTGSGLDDYLGKPVKAHELAAMLERPVAPSNEPAPKDQPPSSFPASQSGTIADVIDLSVLKSFGEIQQEGRPDLVKELIELYIIDTQSRLVQMRTALDRQDGQKLQGAANSLKGSSGNLGLHGMATLCFELEKTLNHKGLEAVPGVVTRLEEEFRHVEQALASELQTMGFP